MKLIFKNIIPLMLVSIMLTSCILEDAKVDGFDKSAISATLNITASLPEGHQVSLEGAKILLNDKSSGLTYSGVADANGIAKVDVAYGTYVATTELKVNDGKSTSIYNGSSESIRVTPNDPDEILVGINLKYSKTSQLIIKEFYYAGCFSDETGKAYTSKDVYLSIYNNSTDIAYLDSICVGFVNPSNAPSNGKVSAWVKPNTTELRDSIPCGTFIWRFKGSGKELPLQPGEEVIVCYNAINHQATVANSVDLSKPEYYAMYMSGITTFHSPPVAGVNLMEMVWRAGSMTANVVSIVSPAVFLFTFGGKDDATFLEESYSMHPTSSSRNQDCVLIDKDLIIDGVECFRSDSDTKRLLSEIDNGYAMVAGTGKGLSVQRKVDNEATVVGGPIIYMDTNNSTNDFEVLPFATLTGKN